jgi:hypothetical protein
LQVGFVLVCREYFNFKGEGKSLKVKMKEDFLYEGKKFTKGQEYDRDLLPARLLNENYVELPVQEKRLASDGSRQPAELEKIPSVANTQAKPAEQKTADASAKAPAPVERSPSA